MIASHTIILTLGTMASFYQVSVGVTDFTLNNYWSTIQPALLKLCPYSVTPDTGIPSEGHEVTASYLPVFSTDSTDTELFHIFVLAYDSKIETAHATDILEWRTQHPGTVFFVLVLDILRSSFSFSTPKSKIETALTSQIGGCHVCVCRYYVDSLSSPDSDVKALRTFFKEESGHGYSHQISSLQAQLQMMDEATPKFAETVSELAYLYRIFGYYQAAACFYRKTLDAKGIPRWPAAPMLVNVVQTEARVYDSVYEIIAAALGGLLRCRQKSIGEQAKDVTNAFARILVNCETPEELFFAHLWIRLTSFKFAESLVGRDNGQVFVRSFVLIGLMETSKIWGIKADRESPFLRQLPQDLADQIDFVEFATGVFQGMEHHSDLIRSLQFSHLVMKGDVDGATALLDHTRLDLRDDRPRRWPIESGPLETLFQAVGVVRERLAPVLLSSSASDDTRLAALRVLTQSDQVFEPQIPLRPHFSVPSFVVPHELSDIVRCSLTVQIPPFMVSLPAVIQTTIGREDEVALQSDPAEVILNRITEVKVAGTCRLIGEFHSICLHLTVAGVGLEWAFPLPIPLQVCEASDLMSFDLKMPCFLSVGNLQGAIFVIDHIDPTVVELSLWFSMSGLREIRSGDSVFEGDETVILRKLGTRIELLLIYQIATAEDDTISVTVSVLRSDGQESRRTDVFEAPPIEKIPLRLQSQSERFQQFTIFNPFPVAFSFSSEGRPNRLRPNSSLSFLREASADPLKLTVIEDGWEDFPIDLVVTGFLTGSLTVSLTVAPGDWPAGSPQIVQANPPSFAVPNKDWVVVPQDGRGETHLFIPRRPGVLKMPDFQVGQQTCTTEPKFARIAPCDCPPFILL
jgi:hypothetical protein